MHSKCCLGHPAKCGLKMWKMEMLSLCYLIQNDMVLREEDENATVAFERGPTTQLRSRPIHYLTFN